MKLLRYSLTLLLCTAFSTYAIDQAQEKELFKVFSTNISLPLAWSMDWFAQALNSAALPTQSYDPSRLPAPVDRPLFTAHPALRSIPHIGICQLPTPVHQLESFSSYFNHPVYMKRDDMTGGVDKNGNARYGGNKPRKLEFEFAQAIACGAKKVATFGCAGSNLTVAVALHAQELGLQPEIFLAPQPNSTVVRENLLWHTVAGSNVHYYTTRVFRGAHALTLWLDEERTIGTFPYIIPTGASSKRGVVGFVNAAYELKEQIDQGELPAPARMYVPCGSTATTLGLALGCKMAGLDCTIVAVTTEPESPTGMYRDIMTPLLQQTIEFLQSYDASIPSYTYDDLNIELRTEFSGEDYGLFTSEGRVAQALMLELENIFLDGTYTAKCCSCLIDDLNNHRIPADQPVLFWNTYCNLMNKETLRSASTEKLPLAVRGYFTEPVQ